MVSDVNSKKKPVEALLSFKGQYHNHKETMAHAAILLQIGLAVGIMSMRCWPPRWIPPVRIPAEWVAFIGFVLMWLLIHIYVWWQLKKREKAAEQVKKLIEALKSECKNCSKDILNVIEFQKDKRNGDKFAKWLLYIGSFLMLIMILIRTLFGK